MAGKTRVRKRRLTLTIEFVANSMAEGKRVAAEVMRRLHDLPVEGKAELKLAGNASKNEEQGLPDRSNDCRIRPGTRLHW